jgi:hypothetical protein
MQSFESKRNSDFGRFSLPALEPGFTECVFFVLTAEPSGPFRAAKRANRAALLIAIRDLERAPSVKCRSFRQIRPHETAHRQVRRIAIEGRQINNPSLT